MPVHEDSVREAGPHVLPRLCHSLCRNWIPGRVRLPQLVRDSDPQLLLAALVAGLCHDGPLRHPVHCRILQVRQWSMLKCHNRLFN